MNHKSQNIYMFKCLNLNANILPKNSDIHNYNTRNSNNFTVPEYNMKNQKCQKKLKSIKVWNKLPADIRP